jgi:hypothetical protein
MTVYVDDMAAPFKPAHLPGRTYVMCHMMADTLEELHAMADRIGVARRWVQDAQSPSDVHYDISLSKRALAVKAGAVQVTWRQMSAYRWFKRHRGAILDPVGAEAAMQAKGWTP